MVCTPPRLDSEIIESTSHQIESGHITDMPLQRTNFMIEFNGSNFVGGTWQNGFGIQFRPQPGGGLYAIYRFDVLKQGPPGIVHGGALAAVLDEAMTAAVFASGKPAFTVNLNIDYRHPVRIGAEVRIEGKVERDEGRKLFTSARVLLADSFLACEAKALFITMQKDTP
jgi:acyl-coenzyme A thioesterase PaaI-like protein